MPTSNVAISSSKGTNYITSNQLARLTGATYRQIDYWCRTCVIPTVGERMPGTGYKRYHDLAIVESVKVLVRVSRALGNLGDGILKRVYENAELGSVQLDHGVTLQWENENQNHLA